MRTIKSLLAAVLTVVMIACMSVSAFAAYEEITYDDVHDMYGTTLSEVNTHYIRFVDKIGVISAHTNGSFDPAGKVTRGEALKIAYRMLHYNYDEIAEYQSAVTGFDEMEGGDITDVALIKPYIKWGEDYQLVNSQYVPDKKFEADRNVSGEEFITLITKAVGISTSEDNAEAYEEFQTVVLEGSELDASSETVNREQAAVIVARAMMYDPNVGTIDPEMFVNFRDFDGVRLNCLATNIYGCNFTTLAVRATENRPMNYEGVVKEVLFSNGVQADVGADLSAFVGYNIDVVYMDKDESGTYTEDEEIITYQMASPIVNTVSLNDISVNNFAGVSGSSATSTFAIYSNTMLYLNDDVWPLDDVYKLTKQIGTMNFTAPTPLTARPNLKLTFIQHGSAENADIVLASEWIPGKLMTVTDNYFSVFSYYDSKVYVYEDNDVVLNGLANPKSGDYVNFYVSAGKLHLSAGTVAEVAEPVVAGTIIKDGAVEDDQGYSAHIFANKSSIPLKEMSGTIVFVLDSTRTTYLAFEEKKASEEIAVEILSTKANADGTADIGIRSLVDGKESTINIDINRIASASGLIDVGDIFTYYVTDGQKAVMKGINPITTNVIETEDYFILEGGQKYLKVDGYTSDTAKLKTGKAVLYIDQFDGVWASYQP